MLEILYKDNHLLIINKLPNTHSINLEKSKEGSLEKKINEEFPASKNLPEAGLVQRLEYSTSGCILAARNLETYNQLKAMIKSKKIIKEYNLLVEGYIQNCESCLYLGSRYRRSKKVSVSETPKERFLEAVTIVELLEYFPNHNISLIKAITKTGRRHQIRATLSHLGHPLVGDKLYSSRKSLNEENKREFYLDASKLAFKHPITAKEIKIEKEQTSKSYTTMINPS